VRAFCHSIAMAPNAAMRAPIPARIRVRVPGQYDRPVVDAADAEFLGARPPMSMRHGASVLRYSRRTHLIR
jgi:hypothetical protein